MGVGSVRFFHYKVFRVIRDANKIFFRKRARGKSVCAEVFFLIHSEVDCS